MCLYAVLKQVGILTDEDIASFKKDGLSFSAHPFMNLEKGIEFSSGSLGQGLSLGVGTALALKLKKNDTSRVFVLLGDGELNEGQVWEAAMSAAHYRLDHLVLIVDKNDLQLDGFTKDIMSTSDVTAKFQAFGWETVCADGHSVPDIVTALSVAHDEKPLAVIAETTKGKGVSFIENSIAWHNGRLSQSQYEQALSEVGGI
jgi:transketolase